MFMIFTLPTELESLKTHRIWGVFETSDDHKKRPIQLNGKTQSSTDESSLMVYAEAAAYMREHGGVLSISLPLASEILQRTIYVVDLDCDKPEFDQSQLNTYLEQETYIDISPSGKGYHLWYSFNRKPTRPKKIEAVDHVTGFITLTGNVYKHRPIKQFDLAGADFDNGHHQPLEQYIDKNLKTLSPIRAFNEQCEYIPGFSPRDLLKKHGYIQAGGSRKFLYPHSTTGAPGIAFYPAHKGDWEVLWSFHSDDPLAGLPRDPFDVFKILECGGDLNQAIAKAASLCKPVDYETNKILMNDKNIDQYNKIMRANNPEVKSPSPVATTFNDLMEAFLVTDDDVKDIEEAKFIIPDYLIEGHVALFIGEPGCGKTALFFHKCKELVERGYAVHYFNFDAPAEEIGRHQRIAKEQGYRMYSPHVKVGVSVEQTIEKLRQGSMSGISFKGTVIVIDTLKKCLDLMSKSDAKDFFDTLRKLSALGATIMIAGHTLKHRDKNTGELIYEGTGDVKADVDELHYLEFVKDGVGMYQTITMYPHKTRGIFKETSYHLDLKTREVKDIGYVDVKTFIGVNEKLETQAEKYDGLHDYILNLVKQGIDNRTDILAWCKNAGYPYTPSQDALSLMCSPINLNRVLTKSPTKKSNMHVYSVYEREESESGESAGL